MDKAGRQLERQLQQRVIDFITKRGKGAKESIADMFTTPRQD